VKIISISLDKKIFEENSAARQRQIEYGKLCEHMYIIVPGKNGVAPKCRRDSLSEKVTAYEVSGNNFKRFFGVYKLAKKIIAKEKIDLITAQDPFATGLLGWLLKRKFSIPLQLQIHTDLLSPYFKKESKKNRIFVLLAKFLIPKADGLRVVSERIKKSFVSCFRFYVPRIFVLPIFVDAEKIKNAPVDADLRKKYPQFDSIILMASRLSREKNIGLAIEAIAEICDANDTNKHTNDANGKNIGLIIVGEGAEKKNIELKIKNLGLENNVILEKWNNDLVSYYKSADLLLLTSNYEGYGLVVAEAMAAGLPVVMTDVGCAGELVIDGENGLVVPIGDKDELAKSIKQIFSDKELYKRLKNGAEKSGANFISKDKYLDLYKKSWEKCHISKP
jgi:glycosyltransferase involved in cell wall biosynthesis